MVLKKSLSGAVLTALVGVSLSAGLTAQAATTDWNASGDYTVAFTYLGNDYFHDMHLVQDASGNLTGNGGSPTGTHTYEWVITSGSVSSTTVAITADYTASADAVTPQTTMHMNGTIAADGTISGTWTDNYQGVAREGTFHTTAGAATELAATFVAEDFGVVSYDTGLGTLKGYSAGFALNHAGYSDATSVVVKLYAGDTLLQTNTATNKLLTTITGSQISSPFDVSGNFDYATDGYWTNTRSTEYGQTQAATRVVATITLEDGTVLTATNTTLAGDPSTIMPVVTPPTMSDKDKCKNNGWKTFTNPSYKNQGQCVSAMERASHTK